MGTLLHAIEYLKALQRSNVGNTDKRCLEFVRRALGTIGITLPAGTINGRSMWAIECFEILKKNPDKYGLEPIHSPLKEPCLVFFGAVGWLPWRKDYAGHIAIYDPTTNTHYANANYKMNRYWSGKLKGAFKIK